MRATPPWALMAGDVRRALATATAPVLAIRACSGVTTSTMVPWSMSAMPRLTVRVPVLRPCLLYSTCLRPGAVTAAQGDGNVSMENTGATHATPAPP